MRVIQHRHYRDDFWLRPLAFGESFDLYDLQRGEGGTRAAMGYGLSRAVCNADGSRMFADPAEAEAGLTRDEAFELFQQIQRDSSVSADEEKNSKKA